MARNVQFWGSESVQEGAVYELTWLVRGGEQVDPTALADALEQYDPGIWTREGGFVVLSWRNISTQYAVTRIRFRRSGKFLDYVPETLEVDQHYGGEVSYELGAVSSLGEGASEEESGGGWIDAISGGASGAAREVGETIKRAADALQDALGAAGAGARGAGTAAESAGRLVRYLPFLLVALMLTVMVASRANIRVGIKKAWR